MEARYGINTYSFQDPATKGLFVLRKQDGAFKGNGIKEGGTINTIVFNRGGSQRVDIDHVSHVFPENCILPLMANQHFVFEHPERLTGWQFNRDFYCIADHDAEVGCVGFLFYGIKHPFFIPLSPREFEAVELLERQCADEISVQDAMQGEMLRLLLKRLIITTTRIAKRQSDLNEDTPAEKFDIVRMFNLLLEANFRKEHAVQFYAKALNKSPKTLANYFALFNYPAPSKLIQLRLIQEAKRYLFYTDKTAKEIGYLLGFAAPAHFSKFFKNQTGENISDFQKQ